jgi:hypothetical protein
MIPKEALAEEARTAAANRLKALVNKPTLEEIALFRARTPQSDTKPFEIHSDAGKKEIIWPMKDNDDNTYPPHVRALLSITAMVCTEVSVIPMLDVQVPKQLQSEKVVAVIEGYLKFALEGPMRYSSTKPTETWKQVWQAISVWNREWILSQKDIKTHLCPVSKYTSAYDKPQEALASMKKAAYVGLSDSEKEPLNALFRVLDVLIRDVFRATSDVTSAHFRAEPVSKRWIRSKLIPGRYVKDKKTKSERWQDDPMMSVKDITWINNSEASEVQSLSGIPFFKVVDKALSTFFSLDTDKQHDSWKELVTDLDRCKSAQLQLLKHVAGHTGKRKSIIVGAGKTTDTKKTGYDYGKASQFVKTYKRDDNAIKLMVGDADKTSNYWELTDNGAHLPGRMLVKMIGEKCTEKHGAYWGSSVCFNSEKEFLDAKQFAAQLEGRQRPNPPAEGARSNQHGGGGSSHGSRYSVLADGYTEGYGDDEEYDDENTDTRDRQSTEAFLQRFDNRGMAPPTAAPDLTFM